MPSSSRVAPAPEDPDALVNVAGAEGTGPDDTDAEAKAAEDQAVADAVADAMADLADMEAQRAGQEEAKKGAEDAQAKALAELGIDSGLSRRFTLTAVQVAQVKQYDGYMKRAMGRFSD